jgi:hypothetical protein
LPKSYPNTRITRADFIRYKVTDNPAPCASCSPNSPAAPVLIKGKQYCLWCALDIAENLLSPKGKGRFAKTFAKILKARR